MYMLNVREGVTHNSQHNQTTECTCLLKFTAYILRIISKKYISKGDTEVRVSALEWMLTTQPKVYD